MELLPEGTTVKVTSKGVNKNKLGTVLYHSEQKTRVRLRSDKDHPSESVRSFLPKNLVAVVDPPPCSSAESFVSEAKPDRVKSSSVSKNSGLSKPVQVKSASSFKNSVVSKPPPPDYDGIPSRPSTRAQVKPTRSEFPFMMGRHRIGHIKLLAPDQENPLDRTLAGYLLGNRLQKMEYETSASLLEDFQAQKVLETHGYRWELIAQRVHSEKANAKHQRLQRPNLYYILTQGPDLEPIDPQEFLSSLADFERLEPSKAASRVELLLTPAMLVKRKPLIVDLGEIGVDYEITEEDCHEGCGSCPRALICKLFGNGVDGHRTTIIQGRMIAPDIGLLKGDFTVKDGINKIQIPSSMVKAGPSKSEHPNKRCLLLVKQAFPSTKNRYMEQYFRAEKPLCDTALDLLQVPLSDMIRNVLVDSGVPTHLIRKYEKNKIGRRKERMMEKQNKLRRSNRIKHRNAKQKATAEQAPLENVYFADAFCVGAADPTPGADIPHGFVVVPGLPGHVDSVLVTRSPCMHKGDLVRLPLLKTKPRQMNQLDWDSLNSRNFGDIYFGSGPIPLPNLIADGDLDGDLYFVMWDNAIVDSIDPTDVADLERPAKLPSKRGKRVFQRSSAPTNKQWFADMQDVVANVGLTIRISNLIGCLYTEAKIEWESDEMDYEDYVALGNAYKKSLDLRKHGDSVELPEHLWDAVPEKLHEFLTVPP